MNNDTLMCEHHEVNYIQSEAYQNQNSHDSYSYQSHHDPNDSEKLLTDLNNVVKNDLEDFKSCIRNMRTVHYKLFRDDEQTDRTEPPPPPRDHNEHVNVAFIRSGKSDDPPRIQEDPPPPIIVNNKIKKDKPIKT
ncbi:hypothetical protein Tco_0307796 [Tanacetum coccineum]